LSYGGIELPSGNNYCFALYTEHFITARESWHPH